MKKKVVVMILGIVLCLIPMSVFANGQSESVGNEIIEPEDLTFATVVKSMGFAWFKRMEEGVLQFGDETGVVSFEQGPSKADAALQVQVVEDLIAQDVDAICVVPFQIEPLEPTLKRAREQGIIVVSHEASNAKNVDYDVEAFNNAEYGRHIMDELAERMDFEGQYVVFVGSLTSTTHNEWVDAAIEHQKAEYPAMEFVGTKNESYDDIQKAYELMKELLKTYPSIKGVQGSSAVDVVGAGQAIEEAGLENKIAVVGTSITSYAGELLKTGAIDLATAWDPAIAGYAMNKVALLLAMGEEITNGMDLGVPGFENIFVDGKVIYGSAWIDISADNMHQYDF